MEARRELLVSRSTSLLQGSTLGTGRKTGHYNILNGCHKTSLQKEMHSFRMVGAELESHTGYFAHRQQRRYIHFKNRKIVAHTKETWE